jgi:hypothetical protein
MRLWSLHPRYLDGRGLVALWREALLAQAVLAGVASGYRHHPQLIRFHDHEDPEAAIGSYLRAVVAEAESRGYRFDSSKIRSSRDARALEVTSGQVRFEWDHLRTKLGIRDPMRLAEHAGVSDPVPHPLFRIVAGPVAGWERGATPLAGDGGQS